MNFHQLTHQISALHTELQSQAAQAVNHALTMRNWLIRFYIVEFEQQGEDKAKYGVELLKDLAESLEEKTLSYRNLRLYRQFYLTYPQIWQSLIAQLNSFVACFKDEMQEASDNHPVGILLCTEKGAKLAEYALSGMDHQLFISKYQVELPSKEQLQSFIKEQLKKL